MDERRLGVSSLARLESVATLDSREVQALADFQHGVLTRGQALLSGLTARQVDYRVTSGRWSRLHAGVFLTQPGRRDRASAHSAAVLACGPGAVLSHASAAVELGLVRSVPPLVHVTVPWTRRVADHDGVHVHRAMQVADATEEWQWPPRTSVERTVIDVAAQGTPDDAIAVAALACQRGLTWYEALRDELAVRARHPHRTVLAEALADIGEGSQSTLEVRFVRDVARPHGLPAGRLQLSTRAGVHDVGYDEQKVLIELDGLAFHGSLRSRVADTRRDRRGASRGWLTVRVVWVDVALHACATAVDVGAVLNDRGWTDQVTACRRRDCAVRVGTR